MGARKIVNEQEVLDWFKEGRTYDWMTSEYMRKYHIETSPTMWSNFRRRKGLDRRIVRDENLVPWTVLPKHRWLYPLQMLRAEGRRRAGYEMRDSEMDRLRSWLTFMEDQQLVVHYDPELDEGFVYVPRESGDDLIHKPRTARPAVAE